MAEKSKSKSKRKKPARTTASGKTRSMSKKKSPSKTRSTAKPARRSGTKKTAINTISTKYTKKDLQLFEKRLLEERERVLRQLGVFGENYASTLKDSSGDLSSYSFHMADMGTDAMEREKAFLFASQEGRLLYHIDEALRRLYKGQKYGFCEFCSKKIQRKRLEALPHARLCIGCKSKEESGI